MDITRTCRECGVPLGIARTLSWNSDGTITQKKDPNHRMIFFESDNLDRMWRKMSELLGVTREFLWEIAIEAKSRATRAFLYHTLPWYVHFLARFVGYHVIISRIVDQGLVMGYGKITVGGQYPDRGRPERITVFVEDPYALPLFCGDFKGAAEVTERREAKLTYQALDSRRHQIDVTMGTERLGKDEFAWEEEAARKPGDMEYRRCPSCGSPLELQQFQWDLLTGVIADKETGRRMAMFGSGSLQAVFDEIARALGERVIGYIIEIERENTIAAMSVEEASSGYEGLRKRAAIRGLGLLTRLETAGDRMEAEIANPSIPAYLVGLAAGIYELAMGKRGSFEWALEPDGGLSISISP